MKKNFQEVKYVTSSFCFFQPDIKGAEMIELKKQARFSDISPLIYEVLWFFINPHTIENAIKKGLSKEAIDVCLNENLIIRYNSDEHQSVELWERHNWNRAAYLTFSQLNLEYSEQLKKKDALDLINQRRAFLKDYEKSNKYPKRFRPQSNKFIQLSSKKVVRSIDWEAVRQRRSVRGFSKEGVSLESFTELLIDATENVRIAESSKQKGDLYFLLNSFYSWLIIYVVVQGVEGLSPGVYYFDSEKMQLLLVREKVTDKSVSDCIQQQYWIKGGGFCLFIGAHWERYSWIYRHSRAYINLLIQLGEISEEFILAAYSKGLAGWMTPAVTEGKANQLCKISGATIDILYFMKFGKKAIRYAESGIKGARNYD